ncbi:hypothetical protein BDV12DRAFT_189076 [Aspergillus spectabilis]
MDIKSKLPLFRVYEEAKSITAVANTITLSFAQDPLIKWLRPLAPQWTRYQPETYRWQNRRVQRVIGQGIVLQSIPTTQIHRLLPRKDAKSKGGDGPGEGEAVSDDAGAVVLLLPPPGYLNWTLEGFLLSCKLRLLDIFRPVSEEGTNKKRLDILMGIHDKAMARIREQYQIRDLWYLEVVAVSPALQGHGLGKQAMCSVLDLINDESIVLECTNCSNLAFYQRLGFEVAEEVELVEGGEAVRLWFMLRKTPRQVQAD